MTGDESLRFKRMEAKISRLLAITLGIVASFDVDAAVELCEEVGEPAFDILADALRRGERIT